MSPTTDAPVTLAANGIAKSFGHVHALIDASITVHPGEVVALFGDNGAGKSTFVKTLLGALQPDEGQIVISDEPVRLGSVRDSQARGVQAVPQDLGLAPLLSVVDNMFLGNEMLVNGPTRWVGAVDRRTMTERADAALRELGIRLPSLRVTVGELSGGQRQGVAVARAVMRAQTAVVLDEPTAALGPHQSEVVCELMRTVAARGLGVLVVSHDLPRVLKVADRIAILWRGRTAYEGSPKGMSVPDIVARMVGFDEEGAA